MGAKRVGRLIGIPDRDRGRSGGNDGELVVAGALGCRPPDNGGLKQVFTDCFCLRRVRVGEEHTDNQS